MMRFPRSLSLVPVALLVLAPFLACGGGGGSAPATLPPVTSSALSVSGFSPSSGQPGDPVTLTGAGFSLATSLKLGGQACATSLISDTRMTATVPASAPAGKAHFVIGSAQATALSASAFTVTSPSGPVLQGFSPLQGPVSSTVLIAGSGFTGTSAVYFGGLAAIFSQNSDTQISAVVPPLASSGLITVTAGGATAASSRNFIVSTTAPTLDLNIDGLYLSQSVQSYTGTVPLVANRQALLRVFAKANEANTASASVRVKLVRVSTGAVVDSWEIGGGGTVPTVITEGVMGSSWNLLVPGAEIQADTYVSAEVDPLNLVSETGKGNNTFRFPASGALDVRTVKAWKVTLVPLTQQGLTGNATSSRTAASWVDRLQRMYPMDAVDVKVRSSALSTTGNLNAGASGAEDDSGWKKGLQDVAAARAAEASDRYYFGAVNVNYSGGIAGLGYVASPTALGWDKQVSNAQDGYNYPEVLAHEVGHNFGRYHAPCGVTDPDANWPAGSAYADALIGEWGWDPALGLSQSALKDPAVCKDIMSYCDGHLWVSNYTYGDPTTDPVSPASSGGSAPGGILAFRASSALGDVQVPEIQAAPPQAQDCLMVSGRIRNGKVEIDSSFQVHTLPTPTDGGHYSLLLLDGAGKELLRVPFEPTLIADSHGGEERHFLVVVPLEATVQEALAGLQVQRMGTLVAERRSSERPLAAVREPIARAMKPGKTHLGWDHQMHPKVMVRDPRTGEIIAFLEGGSAYLETDARELECTFSDGVRSERRTLRVIE